MKRRKRWWIVGERVGRAVRCASVRFGVGAGCSARAATWASCSEKTQTMWTTILRWIMVAYDVYAELLGWEVSKVLKRYEKGRTTI